MAKPSVATAIPGVRSVCHGGTSHRAAEKVRADSFVVETNIHYPTESSLLLDSVRKVIELIATLSNVYQLAGWRQHEHFLTKVKRTARQINRLSSRKGADYQKLSQASA